MTLTTVRATAKLAITVLVGVSAAGVLAVAPSSASTPASHVTRPAAVEALALTGRNIAFATRPWQKDCDRVELWAKAKKVIPLGSLAFVLSCRQGLSTGSGVWDVALARTRMLWVTYAGGNLRDWQLWTATPTRRKPKQLRFAELDVDDPPPLHIGPGTSQGVPFAAGREVVFLGDDGAAIFKRVLAAPVQAIAAGIGPAGTRVVAVLTSGPVVALATNGSTVAQFSFAPGEVQVVRLTPGAVVVQVGSQVRFLASGSGGPTLILPAEATLLDVAQGRALYGLNGDLRARTIATGADRLLVDGTPALPALGRIDARGFAWSRGSRVTWRPGLLPGV
jgi:hypothetical protein